MTSFALEAAPRTTRAQSMDVLSSQANIAGYKAVMMAADRYQRLFPMLMTAAGTIKAARVVVLGVGVAGLQAIATAKRLGAVIEASDVRPSVKEQVESLGAKFIDVPYETAEEKEAAEGVGGYARPMPQSWLDRQKAEVAKRVAMADVVITTALIPGRPAPKLITADMVRSMRAGSVIVDLAVGKTDINSFYYSDMIPAGEVYIENDYTVTPITTGTFDTVQTYDFDTANFLGLLVWLNDTLLTLNYDYTVAVDGPRLTITTPLSIGDVVTIREYSNTAGNFVNMNSGGNKAKYPRTHTHNTNTSFITTGISNIDHLHAVNHSTSTTNRYIKISTQPDRIIF